ncbi:MAG: lipoprotein-releasing ABC transporter permease subunit [Rhodospirillales bacterium]|nr:lipoprotein-releasing ABC transporter permease subunit [Rhodospirillales bacterium]MDE2198000.1 lipoprotein-releasing ABC transporter permease subunit [Rhodospirillales bacterium]MDE2574562.1 lipoprotein-releasing ABC transporter permease subunit [Rhodospirillales bacterium]
MFGAFERMVAGRYLRARKGERFVSIIAVFSLVGIALGVATLIVVTSVMSGFQTALVTRALGVNGHVSIEATAGQRIAGFAPLVARMRAVPGVVSVLPVLDGQALLTTDQGGARGGLVRGVTQGDLRGLHAISDHIIAGSLDAFAGDDAIAVGAGIAAFYRLGIGSRITLISPQGAATAFGSVPRVRAFKVVAIFDAGLSDYNNGVVFLPLAMAQIFFQMPDAVTGFQIRVADPAHVEAVLPALANILRGRNLLLRDWRHANDQIVSVLQVQKDTMFIVLGMIVLVAAFNVISSLIMLVKDKRADIAVLRTIGAGTGAILRIFLMCGAFVGVSGTAIGTVIGVVFCRNIVAVQHVVERITGGQVFDSSVFMLTELPNTIDWGDVWRVVALGLVLSLLATLYPSWRAARTDPVEALRHG